MDLNEAIEKKRLASEMIGEFIANAYALDAQASKNIDLPGIGIYPSNEKDKFSITFHLVNKEQISVVESMIEAQDIGLSKDSVDIEITGVAEAWAISPNHENGFFHRPLATGISISHNGNSNSFPGTLGCFVRKQNEKDLLLLSCAHVLLSSAYYPGIEKVECQSTKIVQPAIADGGENERHCIATLHEVAPLKFENFNGSGDITIGQESMDAALALVDSSHVPDAIHFCHILNGNYREQRELPKLTEKSKQGYFPVFKIGRTTKLTTGRIRGFNLGREIKYPYEFNGLKAKCKYSNLISIEGVGDNSFSQPGDSGSIVFDEDGSAIGLVIGGTQLGGKNNRGVTYALPIEIILKSFNLEIVTNSNRLFLYE